MSQKASRHGKGGKTGQHHRATPALRSYDVPPAGPVTVTRADGTVEVQPAQKAKRSVAPPRRKTPAKGVPAPASVFDTTARTERKPSAQTAAARAKDAEKFAKRGLRAIPAAKTYGRKKPAPRSGGSSSPYKHPNTKAVPRDAWQAVACPQCPATPGQQCSVKDAKGTFAPVKIPHMGRQQVARSREANRRAADNEQRRANAARHFPGRRQPRTKDLIKVGCPACGAEPGTNCTILGGHSVRFETYRTLFEAAQGNRP